MPMTTIVVIIQARHSRTGQARLIVRGQREVHSCLLYLGTQFSSVLRVQSHRLQAVTFQGWYTRMRGWQSIDEACTRSDSANVRGAGGGDSERSDIARPHPHVAVGPGTVGTVETCAIHQTSVIEKADGGVP